MLWAEQNHSNCHKMFRDLVTGVKQHPVISLGPGSSMGNNLNLCFIWNSELIDISEGQLSGGWKEDRRKEREWEPVERNLRK